jgi:hypothetical protein
MLHPNEAKKKSSNRRGEDRTIKHTKRGRGETKHPTLPSCHLNYLLNNKIIL